MRYATKPIVTIALAVVTSMALLLTIRILHSDRTQDVPPVQLPDVSFDPCGPDRPSTEWQITSDPSALYTMEAKRRGVTGTVRLAVYFDLDGRVSIAGVIAKLPYGLTEEAVKAAKQIKFKPATACGSRVTEPAEIAYEFPGGKAQASRL